MGKETLQVLGGEGRMIKGLGVSTPLHQPTPPHASPQKAQPSSSLSAKLFNQLTASLKKLGLNFEKLFTPKAYLKLNTTEGKAAKEEVAKKLQARVKSFKNPPSAKQVLSPNFLRNTQFALLTPKAQSELLGENGVEASAKELRELPALKSYQNPHQRVAHFLRLKAQGFSKQEDYGSAARLYAQAVGFTPENVDLIMLSASTHLLWAEASKDPKVKQTLNQATQQQLAYLAGHPDLDLEMVEVVLQRFPKEVIAPQLMQRVAQEFAEVQKEFETGLKEYQANAQGDRQDIGISQSKLQDLSQKLEEFCAYEYDSLLGLKANARILLLDYHKARYDHQKVQGDLSEEVKDSYAQAVVQASSAATKIRIRLQEFREKDTRPTLQDFALAPVLIQLDQKLMAHSFAEQAEPSLSKDLELWHRLIQDTPELKDSDRLNQYGQLIQHYRSLRGQVQGGAKVGLSEAEIDDRLSAIKHGVDGKAGLLAVATSYVEAEKAKLKPEEAKKLGEDISERLDVLLDRAMYGPSPQLQNYLSAKGVLGYLEAEQTALQDLAQARQLSNVQQKRSALQATLSQFAALGDGLQVSELVDEIEQTLSKETPATERLKVYTDLMQRLKNCGCGTVGEIKEQEIKKKGLALSFAMLKASGVDMKNRSRFDKSWMDRGMIAGYEWIAGEEGESPVDSKLSVGESVAQLTQVREFFSSLGEQRDVQWMSEELDGKREALVQAIQDPKTKSAEKLKLSRSLVQLDQARLQVELQDAGDDEEDRAELGQKLLQGIQLWRGALANAKDLEPTEKLSQIKELGLAMAGYRALTQAEKPIHGDSKPAYFSASALDQELAALVQIATPLFQEQVAALTPDSKEGEVHPWAEYNQAIVQDLQNQLRKSLTGDKPEELAFLGTLSESSIKQFSEAIRQGHALLSTAKEQEEAEKGAEAQKSYTQAAVIFGSMGAKGRVKESLEAFKKLSQEKPIQDQVQDYKLVSALYAQAGMKDEVEENLQVIVDLYEEAKSSKEPVEAKVLAQLKGEAELAKANQSLNRGELDQARKQLKAIDRRSPVYSEAQDLLIQMDQGQLLQRRAQSLKIVQVVFSALVQKTREKKGDQAANQLEEVMVQAMGEMGRLLREGTCTNLGEAFSKIQQDKRFALFTNSLSNHGGQQYWLFGEQGKGNLGTLTKLFTLADNPALSEEQFGNLALDLADQMSGSLAQSYGAATQIAQMFVDHPQLGARAKELLEDIPTWSLVHGTFQQLANMSIVFAEDQGEAIKGTMVMVATLGTGRFVSAGAELFSTSLTRGAAALFQSQRALTVAKYGAKVVGIGVNMAADSLAWWSLNALSQAGYRLSWKNFKMEFWTNLVAFGLLRGMAKGVQALGRQAEKTWLAAKPTAAVIQARHQGRVMLRGGAQQVYKGLEWASRVGGLTAGGYINRAMGWVPEEGGSFWAHFFSSSVQDAQMTLAGKIVNRATGGKIDALEAKVHQVYESFKFLPHLKQLGLKGPNQWGKLNPASEVVMQLLLRQQAEGKGVNDLVQDLTKQKKALAALVEAFSAGETPREDGQAQTPFVNMTASLADMVAVVKDGTTLAMRGVVNYAGVLFTTGYFSNNFQTMLKLARDGVEIFRQSSLAQLRRGFSFMVDKLAFIKEQIRQAKDADQPFALLTFPGKEPIHVALVTDPAAVAEVLKRDADFPKGPVWEIQKLALAPGLLNARDGEYQALRKLAGNFYSPKEVLKQAQTSLKYLKEHFLRWIRNDDSIQSDTVEAISVLQLDIAAESFVGGDFKITPELRAAVKEVLTGLDVGSSFALHSTPEEVIQRIQLAVPNFLAAKQQVQDAIKIEIARRRAQLKAERDQSLLSRLVEKSSDDTKISNVLMEALFAGHETTALGLSWLTYEMFRHPEVYEKMQAEVQEFLNGDSLQLNSMADLKTARANLPFTFSVIQESLRLHPPAWLTFRQVGDAEGDRIQGVDLPPETHIAISLWHHNRDPESWDNPDTFDPHRFMDDPIKKREGHKPFGAGRRVCVGQHKAMMDMLIFVTELAQRFDVPAKPQEAIPPRAGASLSLSQSLPLRLVDRKSESTAAEPSQQPRPHLPVMELGGLFVGGIWMQQNLGWLGLAALTGLLGVTLTGLVPDTDGSKKPSSPGLVRKFFTDLLAKAGFKVAVEEAPQQELGEASETSDSVGAYSPGAIQDLLARLQNQDGKDDALNFPELTPSKIRELYAVSQEAVPRPLKAPFQEVSQEVSEPVTRQQAKGPVTENPLRQALDYIVGHHTAEPPLWQQAINMATRQGGERAEQAGLLKQAFEAMRARVQEIITLREQFNNLSKSSREEWGRELQNKINFALTDLEYVLREFESQREVLLKTHPTQGAAKILKEVFKALLMRRNQAEGYRQGNLPQLPEGVAILDVFYRPASRNTSNNSEDITVVYVKTQEDQAKLLEELSATYVGVSRPAQEDGKVFELFGADGTKALLQIERAAAETYGVHTDHGGIAVGSHEGLNKPDQQDQHTVLVLKDGRVLTTVVDGMGGTLGGREAARVAVQAFTAAVRGGASVDEAVNIANKAVLEYSEDVILQQVVAGLSEEEAQQKRPGAVAMVTEVIPRQEKTKDGQKTTVYSAKFYEVGDSEAIVLRFPEQGEAEVVFRTHGKSDEEVLAARVDPDANVVEHCLGSEDYFALTVHEFNQLKKDDLIITGSDGLFEAFGTHGEILRLLQPLIQQARAEEREVRPEEIQRALLREVLIRQKLLAMQSDEGWDKPLHLTAERYRQAYREVTGQEPPQAWQGTHEGMFLDFEGNVGAAHHRTQVFSPYGYDFYGIDPSKAASHFKIDNTLFAVQQVGTRVVSMDAASFAQAKSTKAALPPDGRVVLGRRFVAASDRLMREVAKYSSNRATEARELFKQEVLKGVPLEEAYHSVLDKMKLTARGRLDSTRDLDLKQVAASTKATGGKAEDSNSPPALLPYPALMSIGTFAGATVLGIIPASVAIVGAGLMLGAAFWGIFKGRPRRKSGTIPTAVETAKQGGDPQLSNPASTTSSPPKPDHSVATASMDRPLRKTNFSGNTTYCEVHCDGMEGGVPTWRLYDGSKAYLEQRSEKGVWIYDGNQWVRMTEKSQRILPGTWVWIHDGSDGRFRFQPEALPAAPRPLDQLDVTMNSNARVEPPKPAESPDPLSQIPTFADIKETLLDPNYRISDSDRRNLVRDLDACIAGKQRTEVLPDWLRSMVLAAMDRHSHGLLQQLRARPVAEGFGPDYQPSPLDMFRGAPDIEHFYQALRFDATYGLKENVPLHSTIPPAKDAEPASDSKPSPWVSGLKSIGLFLIGGSVLTNASDALAFYGQRLADQFFMQPSVWAFAAGLATIFLGAAFSSRPPSSRRQRPITTPSSESSGRPVSAKQPELPFDRISADEIIVDYKVTDIRKLPDGRYQVDFTSSFSPFAQPQRMILTRDTVKARKLRQGATVRLAQLDLPRDPNQSEDYRRSLTDPVELRIATSAVEPRARIPMPATSEVVVTKNFRELLEVVQRHPEWLGEDAAEKLQGCIEGKRRVVELPKPLQGKVLELMGAYTKSFSSHLPFHYEAPVKDTRWLGADPREKDYQQQRAYILLRQAITRAENIDQLMQCLAEAPLILRVDYDLGNLEQVIQPHRDNLAELDFSTLRNAPFGIGKKLRDFLEAQVYSRYEAGQLLMPTSGPKDPTFFSELHRLDQEAGVLAQGSEDVYRVLHRGVFLETVSRAGERRLDIERYMDQFSRFVKKRYGEEWDAAEKAGYNLFTGEVFGDQQTNDVQSRYRYARILLNQKLGRPLLGDPTPSEKDTVIQFAKQHLEDTGSDRGSTVQSYADAQLVLRTEMLRVSPNFQQAYTQADPYTRSLILDSFFGMSQHHPFDNPRAAFQLVDFLGRVGTYRELGITFDFATQQVNVSLGDLHSVMPEGERLFFVLHLHPQELVNAQGKVMGFPSSPHRETPVTLDMRNGKTSPHTTNVLFSRSDVELMLDYAQEYFDDLSSLPPIIYDPEQNIFRNWVRHSYGLSYMEVHLDPKSRQATKIKIQYGLETSPLESDMGHVLQAKALEGLSKPGLEVSVTQSDLASVEASIPFVSQRP